MSNTALGAALTIDDSVLAKIQEAEEKIIRLEQTTRTSSDRIIKSFRSMGDLGVQYFIDKLKIAQIELTKIGGVNVSSSANAFGSLSSNVTAAAVAMSQFGDRIFNTKKNLAELIEERKTLTKELTKGEGIPLKDQQKWVNALEDVNRQIKEQMKGVQKLADEYEKAQERIIKANKKTYAEQAKLYQQQNLKQNTTYQGALSFAESANTINRRTKAIQYLTQARAQLSTTDANYTQKLNALNSAIKRMNTENEKAVQGARNLAKQHSNLMNTSDQLMRKLALIFSVSQIQGYVNKLIQVRGEFELQNTALASILQNKDQADKLFGQITELAVKSPFTVKELTTYTKSLAAYQFQYEELYDTTKRLADVASGLGVDMQRLILAVGQVKAAGYLRGTETRQFTEAGFNILGELAKYYSELENRIVSVGEVQERQFKRMIAFQDVEEVFRRVTDAGGMFYQMQEKQAETLAGQMSNLKDSIDLMFNSIGKANDGTLKDMVALVRSFIENWQEVVFVLEPAVAALGAWKALTLLASIGNKKFALSLYAIATNAKTATASISLMTRATTMLAAVGRGLMSVFAIAVPVALIAGVMELYRVTTKASREANELKKALDGISNEGFVRASELISNFKVLAEKAVEAADGSKEQQAALEELQRTYKDILPERELEIDKLRELKGEYDNITTAIYSKIEAQIKEKQIQEVSNTYGTAASEAMDALAKRLTDYNISLSTAKTITNEFKKMLEQGMIKDANQAKTELENLIRLFSGQYASLGEKNIWQRLGWTTGVDVIDEIDDAFNAFTRFNDEVKRLEGEPITPFRIGGGTEMYQSLKEELENIAKFKEDWEKQNKDKFKFKVEFNEESKNALIAEYQKFIADLNNRISSGQIKQGDILSANLIIEEAQKAIEKLDVSPQIAQVNDLRVEFSKLYDIDFEKFNFTKMLEGQGFNDFIKRLDEGIQGYQEIIDVFDEAAKQGIEVPAMQQWALLQGKTIEEIRAFVPVLEEYRAKLALVTKEEDKKKGRDNTEQVFKDRLSFFERANKEYEKLLQNYSKEEARAKVVASMLDEAQQRGVGGIFMSAEFDDKGTLDSLNRVKAMYKSLSDEMRIEFAKAFGGIQLDMDIEVREDRIKAIQNQFSDLFGNYELSLELDKLGLDKSLMSDLFDVDVFDLSEVQDKIDAAWIEMANKQEQEDAKRENRTAKSFSNVADAIKKFGDKGAEEYAKIQEKITESERKELEVRLKQYAEYLRKSISAKAQAEIESQKEIAKIQKTEGLSHETKTALIKQQREETVKIKAKLEWEDFKSSDTYIKMFDDLEYVSDAALKRLKQNLDMIKNSMGELEPDQLKAIQDAYNKIEEQVISRNPFAAMRDAMKEVNELQSQGLSEDVLQQNLLMYDAQAQSLKTQISDIETIIGLKQNGISLDTQEQSFLDRNIQYLDQNIESLRQMVTLKKSALSGVETNIGITNKDLASYEKARMSLTKMSSEIDTIRNLAQGAFSSIKSVLEAVGVESDSTAMIFADMGMSMVDLIAQAVMFGLQLQLLTVAATTLGVAINTALGPIGWAVMAIQGIAMALTAIFQVHDKKKEQEIERQLELIDKLQKSYEKLEEAIDNAYSIDTLERSTDQAIANLKAQNAALQKSIAAEQDKKDIDDDRIKEWQEQYQDNLEAIEELKKEMVSQATDGILDNVLSAARSFTDAWLEAFRETGNGMQGLEDSFDEMISNMLKQQATMLITGNFLDRWKKQLDQYINADDLKLTSDEAKKWVDAVKEDLPALNEALENYFKAMGEAGLEKGDTMSELQKGIQGITEETAQALEALLNSTRAFVADSNLQLKNILMALTAPAPENPYLLELKAQTEQLRTMNSLWSSLSKMSTGNGRVLKVQIV